ncbi:MAG: hypothetical protein QOD53_164 [Thermoleophilaceae bacterium]|jgi:hypothetical protein|nr:hypothetical protein [Thermoleophilaceae bacterium]
MSSDVQIIRDGAHVPYVPPTKRRARRWNRVRIGIVPFMLFACAGFALYDLVALFSGAK